MEWEDLRGWRVIELDGEFVSGKPGALEICMSTSDSMKELGASDEQQVENENRNTRQPY